MDDNVIDLNGRRRNDHPAATPDIRNLVARDVIDADNALDLLDAQAQVMLGLRGLADVAYDEEFWRERTDAGQCHIDVGLLLGSLLNDLDHIHAATETLLRSPR